MSTDDPAAEHPTDETLDEPLDEPLEPAGGDLVETARRRHGTAGAIVAAGMLGIEQVLGRKPK
jgi:hypothetical protein